MIAKKDLRVPDYLKHILQAITQIETCAADVNREEFLENALLKDAIIRNIEIIGEAANNILSLDNEFDKKFPDLRFLTAIFTSMPLLFGKPCRTTSRF